MVQRPEKLDGVKTWTIETRGHRGAVNTVAYSPDGKWVASGGQAGAIRLWSAEKDEQVRSLAGSKQGGVPDRIYPSGVRGGIRGRVLYGQVNRDSARLFRSRNSGRRRCRVAGALASVQS